MVDYITASMTQELAASNLSLLWGHSRSFDKALVLDPRNLQARVGRAEVYLRQERWQECLAETARIEELSPGNSHASRIAGRPTPSWVISVRSEGSWSPGA